MIGLSFDRSHMKEDARLWSQATSTGHAFWFYPCPPFITIQTSIFWTFLLSTTVLPGPLGALHRLGQPLPAVEALGRFRRCVPHEDAHGLDVEALSTMCSIVLRIISYRNPSSGSPTEHLCLQGYQRSVHFGCYCENDEAIHEIL